MFKKLFNKAGHHIRSWNAWRKKNNNPWWFKFWILIRGQKAKKAGSYRAYRITHDSLFYSDYDAAVKFYERRDI